MGFPHKPYDEEIANEICEIIATSDKSLATILSAKDIYPKVTTWFKWIDENEMCAKSYARAKELQAHYVAEQIIEISDDSSQDNLETDFGVIENKEWVNRSKLRVDARKWVAAHLLPKKYGDRIELDGEVKTSVTPESLAAIADKINSNASTR